MRHSLIAVLVLILATSCSTLFPESKKDYQHHYIADKAKEKTVKKEKQYENQDGYFDGMFDKDGNYLGFYKIGAPYERKGKSYTPHYYASYKEIGEASWYGGFFNGRLTANGEIFDSDSVTAAHPTLPLPSIVRVTNLENGKKIMARVNDRGPFAHDRIIDLSEESAKLLGFKKQGIAKVKVELLPNETRRLLKKLNIKAIK